MDTVFTISSYPTGYHIYINDMRVIGYLIEWIRSTIRLNSVIQ